MGKYLLIESSDPFAAGDGDYYYGLAKDLATAGNTVTLFLVQNGVLAARAGARSTALAKVAGGVSVLADDFSLRERGIAADGLIEGVAPAPLDTVIDYLADGAKVVWH